jgi:hypothetical protein
MSTWDNLLSECCCGKPADRTVVIWSNGIPLTVGICKSCYEKECVNLTKEEKK